MSNNETNASTVYAAITAKFSMMDVNSKFISAVGKNG
jgi:hypothetical protein